MQNCLPPDSKYISENIRLGIFVMVFPDQLYPRFPLNLNSITSEADWLIVPGEICSTLA